MGMKQKAEATEGGDACPWQWLTQPYRMPKGSCCSTLVTGPLGMVDFGSISMSVYLCKRLSILAEQVGKGIHE